MKRGTVVKEGELKWKKEGGGSLRFGGRIIKSGEVFMAHPDDIPKAFKNTLTCLTKGETGKSVPPEGKEVDPDKSVKVVYEISLNEAKSTLDGEFYDVVDAQGKVMSEIADPKSKEEAQAACDALNGI